MTRPAAVSLVTDTSGSMASTPPGEDNTKIELVKTDASTFVSIMQGAGKVSNTLGQVGVVGFDTDASVRYAMRQLNTSGSAANGAYDAISRLTAQGRSTNVKAGVTRGQAMASSAPGFVNRGVVLLSDGEWNTGGDPTQGLSTKVPVYTIGFGNHEKLTYLETMAKITGGKYHNTPDPMVLANFYADIIGELQIASVAVNTVHVVPKFDFKTETVSVKPGVREVFFACLWGDHDIAYTGGTPGPDELAVLVHDPSGKRVTPSSVLAPAGGGHAVLSLSSPPAGEYKLTAWFASSSKSSGPQQVPTAFNVFLPPDSIRVNMVVRPGTDPLEVEAIPWDDATPIATSNLSAEAYMTRPLTPRHDAMALGLKRMVNRLGRLHPALADGSPAPELRTAYERLARRLRHQLTLREPVEVVPHPTGHGHVLRISGAVSGSPHQVYYRVRGSSLSSGPFERTSLLTVTP